MFFLTPLLIAFLGVAAATFAQESFDISADNISYQEDNTVVEASGAVQITSPDGSVWADKIIYNAVEDKMVAKGNVVFAEPNGFTVFVDEVTLTGKLKLAALENLKARLITDEDAKAGPTLTASRAEKPDDTHVVFYDAVYSPCKDCGGRKPWQMKASKVTFDSEEKMVHYKNARLEFFGVPTLYTPYFAHPAGQTEPKSGLLAPQFGLSSSKGETLTLSGYYSRSLSEDYVFRGRHMTQRGTQFIAQRRHIGEQITSEIEGSFIQDENFNDDDRSHLRGEAEYVFAPGKRLGVNAEVASDDTYLDDFFGRNPSYLPSTIYAENASEDHYYTVYATRYQDLRATRNQSTTAQVLPRVHLEKTLHLGNDGSQLTFSGDSLSIYREDGEKPTRIIGEVVYVKPQMLKDGSFLTYQASARGDFYHVDGSSQDENVDRFLPQVAVNWEKPFISADAYHQITPRAMLIYAPNGGNPNDIPNEDSVAYELDVSNLFSTNRFAGLDRVETGTRFVYGLDNKWGDLNHTYYQVFFGQSLRFNSDDTLPQNGGTQTDASDWVGQFKVAPRAGVNWVNTFRLDNSDFDVRRFDSALLFGTYREGEDYLRFNYTVLDQGPEEVDFEASYNFSDAFGTRARWRRDLTNGGTTLLSELELTYTHQCYLFSFVAGRRGFTNQDVTSATEFTLNLELLTMGDGRSKKRKEPAGATGYSNTRPSF